MKAELLQKAPDFEPVTITLTFETLTEVRAFYEMINFGEIIDSAVTPKVSSLATGSLADMLHTIYYSLGSALHKVAY